MNKEEQLKIYSAYLPYNLHVQLSAKDTYKNGVFPLIGIRNDGLFYMGESGMFGYVQREIGSVKPILYDISYLTKEIEHEGERFVPILRILDFLGIKYSDYELLTNSVDLTLDIKYHRPNVKTKEPQKVRFWFSNHKGTSFNCSNMNILMYKDTIGAFQRLLSYHFNIFGLTEDQFINKATLTNKY